MGSTPRQSPVRHVPHPPHLPLATHNYHLDPSSSSLTVQIDRTKILSHGRPAIGLLLLKLHIYRCIALVAECKKFHEVLAHVDGDFFEV